MVACRWNCPIFALPLVLAVLFSSNNNVNGEATLFKCASGWGSVEQTITQDQIDDGYCDCPVDGRDEPNTQACSGSNTWTGIPTSATSSDGISTNVFICPQQPNLKLPLSRINDGICDCCEGADETTTKTCPDICEELLRAEREAKEAALKSFSVGANRRNEELAAFQSLRAEKLKQVSSLEEQIKDLNKIESIRLEIAMLREKYMSQRMSVMKNDVVANSGAKEMVGALNKEELETFIIHACQIDGELSAVLADSKNNAGEDDTCVSLRLAGLDMGIMWGDDNYYKPDRMNVKKNEASIELAAILFDNASSETANWKANQKGNGRRRLMDEYEYDGEYTGDYMGYDHDHYDHDAYDDGDDDDDEHYNHNNHKEESIPWEISPGKHGDMIKSIQELPFSKIRMMFLNRAKEVIVEISKVLDGGNKNDSEEDKEKVEGDATEDSKIDPAAFSMVRSSLRRKGNTIMKGFGWAASAKLFFAAVTDLNEDELTRLAIGTIYHANLSSLHVWQILQGAVPDLRDSEAPEESCASPWATACPPKTIQREHAGGTFPPSYIIQAAETFCAQQADIAMKGGVCDEDPSAIPKSIPSSGYYGYSAPVPRGAKDPLAPFFKPMESISVGTDKDRVEALETELADLERKKADLERSINNSLEEVGGRDGNGLGPQGELYSLADKCFDISAGKYIYEVCIFGKASQKDRPGDSGTNLGRYSRMDVDDETGERSFYWENGAKCWNGPHRSATVHVTCGAETKLISADEPETCTYVFEMESHIACDELYKQRMGL